MKTIDFKSITTRSRYSSRGGGMEIALDTLGWPGEMMTAYQNYLGGGMLGKVCNDCTISDWRDNPELVNVAERLKKHFHYLTDPGTEWEGQTFEQNQNMPVSAY